MLPLDVRKVRILQAIVNDYVLTSKPVGSERLIDVYKLGCKSATVRNEMAEMAEMGYLLQPHTSAGRIPTDRGYRYYVDTLMEPDAALSSEETQRAREQCHQAHTEVEDLILQTCRILSELTSYPALATDPSTDVTTFRRVYLSGASPRHVLLVALLSTGHVEHRLIELEAAPNDTALTQLSNYLNTLVAAHDLVDIGRATSNPECPNELLPYRAIITRVLGVIRQVATALSDRRFYLERTSQFLRQPEFQDVQRLENLLNALEQRSVLFQVLSHAMRDCDVTVIIGTENKFQSMQDCSIITTSYHIGARPAGYLGVVGPTRMNYDRATAAVGLMAQSLSQMLTSLCLA